MCVCVCVCVCVCDFLTSGDDDAGRPVVDAGGRPLSWSTPATVPSWFFLIVLRRFGKLGSEHRRCV